MMLHKMSLSKQQSIIIVKVHRYFKRCYSTTKPSLYKNLLSPFTSSLFPRMFLDKPLVDILTSYDRSNFGSKDKIFFLKELGYLLKGGVGVIDAIQTIHDNTDNYALQEITSNIYGMLKAGKPLSYTLSRESSYFDEGDVTIIKSGEKTGNL